MAETRWCSSLILLVVAAVASLGSDCGQAPRGIPPSAVVSIVLRLDSQPAPDPPADLLEWLPVCLRAMNGENNVEPSWLDYATVLLRETGPDVFEVRFNYVPVDVLHTLVVHDRNECRRNPRDGMGHVTTGVTVNDTPLELVRPITGALLFSVSADGAVASQAAPAAAG